MHMCLEQVEVLQQTLSAHISRLPVTHTHPHGRWTWTRGKPRAAAHRSSPPLLPWNSERLNTAPAVFGWVGDRPYVEILASGMYVVACAVFVPGGPTVGITVSGQTVLRRASHARSHEARLVDASGLIAGTSIRDVLSLAAGARLAVQCEINATPADQSRMADAHALLELKRLW